MKIYTRFYSNGKPEKKESVIEKSLGDFQRDVRIAHERFISGYNAMELVRKNPAEFGSYRAIASQKMDYAHNLEYVSLDYSNKTGKALAGWYRDEFDEKLTDFVAEGNLEALQDFILNGKDGVCEGGESAKEYLKKLRFDSDGIATCSYIDASGWCLLNAAASCGQPQMVNFLIREVGMDVDTICYGVSPAYCCLPSMHDNLDVNNFSRGRMDALKAFVENGANLAHQSTMSTRGQEPNLVSLIHTACWIKDHNLRHEALTFITTDMQQKGQDCNIRDTFIGSALDHLNRFNPGDTIGIEILKTAGVVDTSIQTSSAQRMLTKTSQKIPS